MVLKLYSPRRPVGAVSAVLMTLEEKNVSFELVVIDIAKREQKSPAYLAIQPFGQLPCIDDDGFVVFESRAICRYIAHKYADQGTPNLVPTDSDIKARTMFEQAASIEYAHFHPLAFALYREAFGKPRMGLPKDQALFDKTVSELSVKLDVYEQILGTQRYLGGDEFTLADLLHVSFGALLAPGGCDIMARKGPNVTRWWNDILSRPSWRAVEARVRAAEERIQAAAAAAST
ncbi:glutathione S-transferase [Mycena rebaudengoi]|nr:glutathione S-transferase [Mycena rebaudengoi]